MTRPADRAPPAQPAWRSIESAPENESVLIFIPNWEHYGHGVYRGMLVNMGTGKHWDANAVAMGRSLGPDMRPTHWMPLPLPPGDEPAAPAQSDEPMPRTVAEAIMERALRKIASLWDTPGAARAEAQQALAAVEKLREAAKP